MKKGELTLTFEALAKKLGIPENVEILSVGQNLSRGYIRFLLVSEEETELTIEKKEAELLFDSTENYSKLKGEL